MPNWSTCSAVERDSHRLNGEWVFCGTRVPVSALFENLGDGASLDQFVEWFAGVTLEQARIAFEHSSRP
jgi:uncharacterized protein (DUF433 family)